MTEKMKQIQKLFDKAKHIVFLTGAGVSTPSGLPDFASKDVGLDNDKAFKKAHHNKSASWFFSTDCLYNHPKLFYNVTGKMLYPPKNAKPLYPNLIHKVQAKYTRLGKAHIITQDIDNLYEKAHVDDKRIIYYYGSIYHCHCTKCGKAVDWRAYRNNLIHKGCGGYIRPDVIMYGDNTPWTTQFKSNQIMDNCDLIVIMGTTMRAYPFNELPLYAPNSTPTLIVNKQPLMNLNVKGKVINLQMDGVKFFKQLKIR